MTKKQISEELGMHANTLTNWGKDKSKYTYILLMLLPAIAKRKKDGIRSNHQSDIREVCEAIGMPIRTLSDWSNEPIEDYRSIIYNYLTSTSKEELKRKAQAIKELNSN